MRFIQAIRWALGHGKTVILATTIALIASIALIPLLVWNLFSPG